MFENRHIFNGRINGQSVNDFTLNYSFSGLDDRLDYLYNILDLVKDKSGRNFFEAYFDVYYKVDATSEDNLAEKNNICRRLELMADYLLRSTEIRALRKSEETKYYFYVNREEFLKRTKLEVTSDNVSLIGESNQIDFLLPKSKPVVKKEKIQKITKEDYERNDEVGRILREYQTYIDLINDSINSGVIAKRRGAVIKGLVSDDMLKVKDQLLGVFGYNMRNLLVDSTCPDWDKFDYTNLEHLKIALNISKELDPNDDLSHIIMDLDMAIKELIKNKKLTARQLEILTLYRQGYCFTEIAKEINTTTVNTYKTIKTIIRKIAKHYEDKEKK